MGSESNRLDEPQRLAALAKSRLMEEDIDPTLERLTQMVCAVLHVPVALVSLVSADRQYFKSHCGLHEPWATKRETPLSHSFCQHVVRRREPLLITDARENELVAQNLAVCDIGVIAYAGVPIFDDEGQALGSLCAIDGKPREWSTQDVELLKTLSMQISSELLLRKQSTRVLAELAQQNMQSQNQRSKLRLDMHDLRTPLSAMLLGLEAMKALGPVNEAQGEMLGLTKRNGQALLTLVNDMQDIDAIDQRGSIALHRTACAVATIAEAAVGQVRNLAAAKKLTLDFHVDPSVTTVFADCDRLSRVLVNLLGNAIKFTSKGGVDLRVTRDGKDTRFAVRDSGIGMQNAERIFEEGVRLGADGPLRYSAGLGLTFCKRVIEAHGGQIGFETEPGVGSTFFFTIPEAS